MAHKIDPALVQITRENPMVVCGGYIWTSTCTTLPAEVTGMSGHVLAAKVRYSIAREYRRLQQANTLNRAECVRYLMGLYGRSERTVETAIAPSA
jgi:hypothetical protein